MRATNPGFVPDSPFYRPLGEKQLQFFRTFPKAELHCHLLGTISEATFRDLVRESNAPVTSEEITEFFTRGEKPVGVLRIFRALEEHILVKPEYLKRITIEHIESVSKLGVKYIELFWNWTGLKRHYGFNEGAQAIVSGIHEARERFGVEARLIPAIDREASAEDAVELVEEMIAHRDPMIVGLGIDYRETNHEPENFWKAFKMAKEAGFHVTIHAGEFGEHYRNVETAVELCGSERVDHGYTITDSPELMRRYKEKGMIFAVVPTNSYYLRTFSDEEWAVKHPIRAMHAAGLRLFPNSDDPTMHHVNVAESWQIMHQFLDFSIEDLRGMLEASIDAAWVGDDVKAEWKRDWLAEFDRLAAEF